MRSSSLARPDNGVLVRNTMHLLTTRTLMREIAFDMAQGFWQLLIPFGLQHGALAHIVGPSHRDGDDVRMSEYEDGWKDEYTQWWFDFLQGKGVRGISKDVWQMVSGPGVTGLCMLTVLGLSQFLEFVRVIDSKFERYDPEGTYATG